MLAHAAQRDCNVLTGRLAAPAEGLAGFPWYDALPRIVGVAAEIGNDGRWSTRIDPLEPMDWQTVVDLECRPERIRLVVTNRTPHGGENDLHVETDLAFAGEPLAWACSTFPVVRQDTTLTARALAQTIEDAFFCPCEEAGTRAEAAERTGFGDDALAVAAELLCDAAEAVQVRTKKYARESLGPLAREYRRALTIRVDANGEASVAVDAPHPAP